MIHASFSYFDGAVLGILGLSCLFAFIRGLVKEMLSLGAWIGAGLITLYFFPELAKKLEPSFKSPVVAAGVATLGLYVVSLLCFSIVNAIILKFVKEGSDVGFLDNTLGLMFGAARGAFIISLGFFMLTIAMKEEEYPEWLKGAQTRPLVEESTLLLVKIAPDYLAQLSSLHEKLDERNKAASEQRKLEAKKTEEESGVSLKEMFSKEPAR
jgi:membrane protein required for colicin V production